MKKINVLISFGTRPEAIKFAPLIKVINTQADRFDLKICSTGQHQQMLSQVLDFFEIKPDIKLDLMTENQSLSSFSARLLNVIDDVFLKTKPDVLLIQGDTTTAFLTALAAYYKKIKIGHVEAGLRTYERYGPFPEEINRQLVSRVADFNFAPTQKASDNLINEKIDKKTVFLTGNTVVDALNWANKKINRIQGIGVANKNSEAGSNPFSSALEVSLNLIHRFENTIGKSKMILVTMHRRESFGEDLKNMCRALKSIAEKYKDIKIIYPVHLNPNVRTPVKDILSETPNIILAEPVDYMSFIWLMQRAYFIVTDSGGVQEEAPTFKKPVLVLRKFTERTESVDIGISRLVGTDKEEIEKNISELLDNETSYNSMISEVNPYGDGKASERIVQIIYENLKKDL